MLNKRWHRLWKCLSQKLFQSKNTDTDGVNVAEQYLKLIHSEDVGVQENVA